MFPSEFFAWMSTETMAHRVTLSIADPWELGEAISWRLLQGEVLQFADDLRGGRALVRLDDTVEYAGRDWNYVVVSPRHEGSRIASFQNGSPVPVACMGLTDAEAELYGPGVPETWRGGLAFIADLQLTVVSPGSGASS
jgi:hypothetical protein